MKSRDRLLPGSFLIASPRLRDPNFARAVVLVCDHGSQGSWGLIVNRRTALGFGDVLEGLPWGAAAVGPVYWGGPCETSRMQVLHRLRSEEGSSVSLCRNVDLGLEAEKLKQRLAEPLLPGEAIHGFVGYAGWSPDQLAHELEEKSWIVSDASAYLVFDTPAEEVWDKALEALGPPLSLLARIPVDPQVN